MEDIQTRWSSDKTLGDLLNSKLGYELLSFVSFNSGKSIKVFDKFYLRPLPLRHYKTISRLTGIDFDKLLIKWLLRKLNKDKEFDFTRVMKSDFEKKWWKESVIYQIFLPSFYDSNNDGYGDLKGIIARFEYLLTLNIDAILLSPIFDSPMHETSYDVRNYYQINSKLGNKDDLKELVSICHLNKIKVILTMPINQTSDEHEWFKNVGKTIYDEPLASRYKEFYISKETPNNWQSLSGDSAWRYDHLIKRYFLDLKSNHQVDLNWQNPEVRQEMIKAMQYWQSLGIDGLFLESSEIIAKNKYFPEGSKSLALLTGISGMEHYIYQPDLLDWLAEIYQALKEDNTDFLVVSDCLRMQLTYSKMVNGDNSGRSDLGLTYPHFYSSDNKNCFSSNISLDYLCSAWLQMQNQADNSYWPVLMCEDPKHPRVISRIGINTVYRTQVAKLLATMQLTAKGTVLLYQGQELGQVNAPFHSIEQMRDFESRIRFDKLNEQVDIIDTLDSFEKIIHSSKDHARVPIVWDNEYLNNGFSENKKTWIDCFADPGMSVADQTNDAHSVLNYYRSLISLRSHFPTLIYGDLYTLSEKNIFRLLRYDNKHAFYIEINVTDEALNVMGINHEKFARLNKNKKLGFHFPSTFDQSILLSNYPDRNQQDIIKNSVLRPYEAFIIKLY